MTDLTEFSDIRPYTDEEAAQAFQKIAEHPLVLKVSSSIFPNEKPEFLREVLRGIKSVDEFQNLVMTKAVEWVLATTAHNFSYDGIENIMNSEGKHVFLSNHRDIVLDPAITQLVLFRNGLQMTEIAVGDNLLTNQYVEALIRSNRMIKVIRGISARTLYLSSQLLSKYIRQSIVTGSSSIWIAQREGRAKNGIDVTEQGLLKMLDMSGTQDFVTNFEELNIIPLSISYEYEPCDAFKARELLVTRNEGKYVKAHNEDIISIVTGIKQQKGNIHLNIGKPLTHEEILEASYSTKNDRYQAIRHAVDVRVIEGYMLWKNNYMGYDLANGSTKYSDRYDAADLEQFKAYIEGQLDRVQEGLDRAELRDILLRIYGNPVAEKEKLLGEQSQ